MLKQTKTLLAVSAAVLLGLAGRAFADTDTDSDGLPDALETAWGTSPTDADSDDDDLTDLQEYLRGTNPGATDTDLDSQSDGYEVSHGTNPLLLPTGDPDGGSAIGTGGFPALPMYAWAGTSPRDGVNVWVHSGAYDGVLATLAPTKGLGMGFAIRILHNSQSSSNGIGGRNNFVYPLDMSATEQTNGDVDIVLENGGVGTFVWNSTSQTFTSPPGCTCVLTKISTGVYERSFPTLACSAGGPQKYRFEGGLLVEMEDRFGNNVSFTRNQNDEIITITDTRGEDYTLSYYDTGRLESVAAPDGATWTLAYNVAGQLYSVVGPATTTFPNGIKTEYAYVNGSTTGSMNNNLAVFYDGRGTARLRNHYDTSDRVVRQYDCFQEHFDFDYANAGSQNVTVTDRVGNERVWHWDSSTLAKTRLTEKTNRNVRSGEGDYDTYWTNDSSGYVTEVKYPRGNGVKYTLNSVWLPTEVRRKTDMTAEDDNDDDLIETYAYDSSKYYGKTSYTDPEGNQTSYTLNSYGQPTQITFPTITHTDPDVTITNNFTYNSDGTMASFEDGEGKDTSYSYYSTGAKKGRLYQKVVDYGDLGLTTTWDYTNWGDVSSLTDPRGNTTTYTVERCGNVTKVESPSALGYVTEYLHDGNLNVIRKRVKNIDWDGTWLSSPQWYETDYTLNIGDQLEGTNEDIDATEARVTSYDYDANGQRTSVSRGGRTMTMLYDERGLLYKRTGSNGQASPVEEWTYDGNRNVTAFKNPRGKTTSHDFDLFDRETKTINALGHYELLVYSKDSHVTERKSYEEAGTTDVLLAHHKATYDEMGRAWKEEDALLGTTTTWYAREYTFDKRGLVTTAKDRRNYETDFAYDGAGRRVSSTDPLGNVTEWEHDANGNTTAVEETEVIPGSQSTETYRTEFEYDALNRRKKQSVIDRTDSNNKKVTEWKLSALGLRKTVDPLANEVAFTLDGLGRTTQNSEDLGSSQAIVTQWTYGDNDEVLTLTDDNGHETNYAFDALGRLTTKTYEARDAQSDPTTVSYEYDLNGNVVEIEDQNGTITAQGFDDLDRLTGRAFTLGTGVGGDTDEDFEYDALNRLTLAADNDSRVQLTYDSLSRVLTETQGSNPLGTTGKTVTYTWDAEGNRTKIDYPSGFDANEARDALGRITSITDQSQATVASFELYGSGLRRKKVTLSNGTYSASTYDGFRRPTAIDHKDSGHSEFAGFDYAWDKNDNPLYEARSHLFGRGDVYSYDKANRLKKVLTDCDDPAAELASPGTEAYDDKLEYDMDDVFNLTAYKVTPYGGSTTTTDYTTNPLNEYTEIESQSLSYTEAGSLEDDGNLTYKYDAREHLIEVKEGSTTIAAYVYDALGLGRRIAKTVGSAVTRYVYAGQQSVEEYDGMSGSASLSRLFVFGQQIDQIVMMEAPDYGDEDDDSNTSEILRFSYHAQIVGSVTQVTGPTGSVAEQYLYDPYGKPTIKDGSGSTISTSAIRNPYLFTGRQLDEETGLYYYRARCYTPERARFIQRDPLEYIDGPNALAYVGCKPVKVADATGLSQPPVPPQWWLDAEEERYRRENEGGGWVAGAGAIALAEPTPFGEILFIAAAGAYLCWKAANPFEPCYCICFYTIPGTDPWSPDIYVTRYLGYQDNDADCASACATAAGAAGGTLITWTCW